jgi:glucose/arabinose dehydrogenase
VAAGLAFAGIVHAQQHQLGGGVRRHVACSTTLTLDAVGFYGGLAVGRSGDVFVSEPNAGCVIRVDSAGVGHMAVGGGRGSAACPACGVHLVQPTDVEAADDGTLYVLDRGNGQLVAVKPDGTTTVVAGDLRAGPILRAFTRDAGGRLYATDLDHVYRLDPAGRVVVAGGGGGDVGPGAPATGVRLSGVTALAAAPDGTLYLAQERFFRVLRVDPAGTMTVVAGTGLDGDTGDGGPATKANLDPSGVAADEAGNLYIGVQFAHRVRRVDRAGQIATFAGRGSLTYLRDGDGGPALQAGLGYPTDLAFRDGALYILDDVAQPRVRKVDRAGIITTVAGR